jgi:hypothetical protein
MIKELLLQQIGYLQKENEMLISTKLKKIPAVITESFIGEFPKYLNNAECETFIALFKFYRSSGYVSRAGFRNSDNERVEPTARSETDYVFVSSYDMMGVNHPPGYIVTSFFEKFGSVVDQYCDLYGVGVPNGNLQAHDLKVQEVKPTGGYHVWHTEWAPKRYLPSDRIFVYQVYLTDHEDEGETEFLYQGIKIKPEMGKLLMWPAHFTHPHRGNPVYKKNKYIATGWVTMN